MKHLKQDLMVVFNNYTSMDFNLDYSAIVILHGIGGMTVSALRNDVPDVASKLLLDI